MAKMKMTALSITMLTGGLAFFVLTGHASATPLSHSGSAGIGSLADKGVVTEKVHYRGRRGFSFYGGGLRYSYRPQQRYGYHYGRDRNRHGYRYRQRGGHEYGYRGGYGQRFNRRGYGGYSGSYSGRLGEGFR